MEMDVVRSLVRDIPDFPKPGIVFKDITPLIAQPDAFAAVTEALADRIRVAGADEILAIESRGFIFGAAVARLLHLPLQLIRKPGKLPGAKIGMDYDLEYGSDRIEVHREAIVSGRRYAIVDDLVATGGTAEAVARLVEAYGAKVAGAFFVIELEFLPGRRKLAGRRVESLIRYA